MSFDYSKPFWIEGKQGNNALSYEERAHLLGRPPRLYVPSVKEGRVDDLEQGFEVGFEDIDEFGLLQSCKGLKHLIRTRWGDVPMVIVDNHNHAFYFWWEAFFNGQIEKGASLVHLDQHKDMRRPEHLLQEFSLESIFNYTHFELHVGNYIVPAQEAGLIEKIQLVTSELEIENLDFVPLSNKILNIDLDFFAPELDYIDFKKTKDFIRAHLPTTSLITVASSPFFIEQSRAFRVLRELMNLD